MDKNRRGRKNIKGRMDSRKYLSKVEWETIHKIRSKYVNERNRANLGRGVNLLKIKGDGK